MASLFIISTEGGAMRGERGTARRGRWDTWATAALCLLLAAALVCGGLLYREARGAVVPKAEAPLPGGGPLYMTAAGTEGAPLGGEALGATEIYIRLSPACVGVTTPVTTTNAFGQSSGSAISGSGFLVSADGYVVTNYHVIERAHLGGLQISVMLLDGRSCPARILGGDEDNDVALLKIDGDALPFAVLGDFEATLVGETVYAIGNPLGELSHSMTSGIVSALERTISIEPDAAINMFQIDAAINAGNSGGPVVNARGEVIGIASAKYASSGVEGLGFAIPIDDAMRVVDELAAYGYVRGKPLLGVTVAPARAYGEARDGALVAELDPTGCCARAGLRAGDVITALDETPIAGSADLIAAKNRRKAGDTVVLSVLRGEEALSFDVTLDEKPRR